MQKYINPASRISLRHLRYFIAVAETGQIKRAAQRENISPSAITDSIKHLEETLSAKLVERHRNGMNLTQEGYRFIEPAKSVIDLLNNTLESFQNQKFGIQGKITIGTTPSVLGYFIPLPITRIKKAYPDIQIEIKEYHQSNLVKEILNGNVDVAVMITSNLHFNKSLKVKTVFNTNRTLWCSTMHPLASEEKISLERICAFPYIQLTMDEALKDTNDIWKRYGNHPKTHIQTESIEAVRSLVANGHGITILSELLYRPWSFDGARIISKPIIPKRIVPTMNLGLVYQKENSKNNNECLNILIDFFQQEVKSHNPLYRLK